MDETGSNDGYKTDRTESKEERTRISNILNQESTKNAKRNKKPDKYLTNPKYIKIGKKREETTQSDWRAKITASV